MTHICVSKLTSIGANNGLSPDRRQSIIWTNAGLLLIGPLGTNFSEILIEIRSFSFKKMHLKMSSAKWRLFRLGLNELTVAVIGMEGTVTHVRFHCPLLKPYMTWLIPDRCFKMPSTEHGLYHIGIIWIHFQAWSEITIYQMKLHLTQIIDLLSK